MSNPDAYEQKLTAMRPYLTPEMSVLEIGCGSGNTGRRLAPLVASYRAMDLSSEMIRLGREEAPIPDNMTMEVGDCDTTEFGENVFDAVIAMNLLHLLPDPARTVHRLTRALRPGGSLITGTVTLKHLWWLRLIATPLQMLGKVPDLRFMTQADTRALMTDAGLTIEMDSEPPSKISLFLIARKPG